MFFPVKCSKFYPHHTNISQEISLISPLKTDGSFNLKTPHFCWPHLHIRRPTCSFNPKKHANPRALEQPVPSHVWPKPSAGGAGVCWARHRSALGNRARILGASINGGIKKMDDLGSPHFWKPSRILMIPYQKWGNYLSDFWGILHDITVYRGYNGDTMDKIIWIPRGIQHFAHWKPWPMQSDLRLNGNVPQSWYYGQLLEGDPGWLSTGSPNTYAESCENWLNTSKLQYPDVHRVLKTRT